RLRMAEGGRVRADFPEEVRALNGERLPISGFLRPAGFVAWADGLGEFSEFVLSRYSPDCPYCPAAGPTETIQVFFRNPVAPTETMVCLDGVLQVQDRMERGAFYRLLDAVVST